MGHAAIAIEEQTIRDFCHKHHIRKMALFGSVLRDDFTSESDVDVLVEFEPGHTVGLITFAGMENELSDLLGRKIDMNTFAVLSPYFREEALREARVLYVAP